MKSGAKRYYNKSDALPTAGNGRKLKRNIVEQQTE